MKSGIDPRICNIAIDANALDRDGGVRDQLVDRLLDLRDSGKITLIMPRGVRREIERPRTPGHVRRDGMPTIFTLPVGLNSAESARYRKFVEALRGNARPGKHDADADHLFEADKYCGYFVTHDQRILDLNSKHPGLLQPALKVVTLAEFLEIFASFEAANSRAIASRRVVR